MLRALHRAAVRSAWTFLVVGAVSSAAPAEARSTIKKPDLRFDLSPLAPAARASLKKIDVLLLKDDNLHLVWRLKKKPRLADVIVVACSPACLSTDVLEALTSWAQAGGGLFLEASAGYMASRFLLPEGYFIEPYDLERAIGYAWLEQASPLTRNVRQISKELWCSRDGRSRFRLRSTAEDERSLQEALFDLGESFLPILTWSPAVREPAPAVPVFDRPGDPEDAAATGPEDETTAAAAAGDDDAATARSGVKMTRDGRLPILFASTWRGARVVWYAYDFTKKKGCAPELDDVRLWSNLIHWLARRELAGDPAGASHDSGGAR